MMEKWKQKAVHMNFKKAVIIFLVTCFVVTVSVPAALYGNFRNRIPAWEQVQETDRELEAGENSFREEERLSQENERDSRSSEKDSPEKERDSGNREKDSPEKERNSGRSEKDSPEKVRDSGERERDSRNDEWDSREHDESGSGGREQKRDSKERKEKDLEEMYRYLPLSWSDIALLAGCVVAWMALGIWYWLLVMVWACRKAYRLGVNGGLAVLAALFFNLAAVAALYLYGMWKGTCAACGRVKSGNGTFCARCGSPLKKECPQCGQEVDLSAAYCGHCGKKLEEETQSSSEDQ